ncbi:TonB-dependent receptor [Alcaligenaceae bacterium CGII-47]|nr:TonB-dependent receptor [Alcaligenaceae bacterium CGII-47]
MLPILTRRVLVVALFISPLAATAQPPANTIQKLDDIVVTASRTPETLRDVVGDVTVIDQQTLQAAGKDSLAEILSRQPGVQFASTGGPQTVTTIFLRGTNSQHTLVLIDGIRVNGSTNGGVHFPAIDPAAVERIEILRGAASSLYGSDAIGGVINIITKKGEQDQPLSAWANFGYGTYETAKSSMGLSGANNGWDYSLSTSAASSKGFDASRRLTAANQPNSTHYPDRDGYRQHTLSGTLGYQWATGQHIGLTAYNGYTHGDQDTGTTLPNAYNLTRQQSYSLSSTNQITKRWESVLRFGLSKDSYEDRSYQSITNSLKRDFSWQNNLQLHPDHRVSVLFERLEERLQASTPYDQTARNTNAAALIYNGHLDRLHTQASVRNDNISGYGNQATGSLGFDIDLNDDWQIGIASSTGFHAPTFNDMYYPFEQYYWNGLPSGSYQGNPNLKPERSRNIEAHIRYQTSTTQLSLTAYQNRIEDLIDGYVCGPTYDCTSENINQATIRGLTLSAEHDFGDTKLRASADFLDPRNDRPVAGETGSQLPLRARQVFQLSAEHRIQAVKLGAEYQYTGQRYTSLKNDVTLGGFSLFNLTAAYDINKNLGVQVRWNNVLDKDYVLIDNSISAYNTPGSNVFVNLSWKM